jgi:hypothetical protein
VQKLELSLENKYINFKLSAIIFIITLSLQAQAEDLTSLKTSIDQIDERLTDTELRSAFNRINFGIDFKADLASMNDVTINGTTKTKNNGVIGSLLFRLNVETPVNDVVKLYASAESLSFFNDDLLNNTPNINNREAQIKGEKLSISKAYIDWAMYQKWLTFSIGRLPTVRGPPSNLKEGTVREGTYPVSNFSLPLDGVALTAKISAPLNLKDDLYFRAIYSPGGVVNSRFPFKAVSLGNPDRPTDMMKSHKLYTVMAEYDQYGDNTFPWRKMLAILQYTSFKLASPQSFVVSGGLFGATDLDIYRLYIDEGKFLDEGIVSPYLEFEKLFHTQFDFYATASFLRSGNMPNIKAVKMAGPGTREANKPFVLGQILHGQQAGATRVMAGMRYEFPERAFLGAEVVSSSSKMTGVNFYSNGILNPNYFNGNTYEVYGLKAVGNNNDFVVRLGYTFLNLKRDSSSGFFYRDTDEKVKVVNLSFNVKI